MAAHSRILLLLVRYSWAHLLCLDVFRSAFSAFFNILFASLPSRSKTNSPARPAAVPAPAPTIDLTTGTCARWYTITGSDRRACDNILTNGNMTLDELRIMNPFVNDNCTNLWIGYSYCILGKHFPISTLPTQRVLTLLRRCRRSL